MNKVIKVVSVIVLLIVSILSTLFVVNRYFRKGDISTYDQTQFTNEDGLKYTQLEWSWKPCEIKETPVLVDSILPTKQVYLLMEDNRYCLINVPSNIEYFYDYGKAIYAKDGSYCVYIVKADASNLSSLAGIKHSENITKSSITNKVSKNKEYRVIASLIGETGYGVICEVYKGNDVYTTIYNNFLKDNLSLVQVNVPSVIRLEELPKYAGNFTHQININGLSLSLERYLFEDGYLYKTADYSSIEDIKTKYLSLLMCMSGTQEVYEYSSDNICFYEAGNCYLGLLKYNDNTTVITIGQGEEAKCNVLYSLTY